MPRIEQVQPAGLRKALAYVLATPGGPDLATPAQVEAYLDYLAACRLEWEALQLRSADHVTGLVFVLLLPGSAAMLMLPTPGEHGINPNDQARVQAAALERLGRRRLRYAQTLLEPEATAKRAAVLQAGFRRLTTLLYLERDVAYPPARSPARHEAEWVPFHQATYEDFAATLLATYENSLDCPELTGMRPVDDVIASHQATGVAGSKLWELARREGQNAGCILLSTLARGSTVEIVYMGVVPAFRRLGLGKLLLQRALQRARQLRATRMLVVVDQRNTPARRLYERFGFASLAARDAYLYSWPDRDGAP
jgi:ribosomal protein S18 acetylase RimI-like enzyme